MIRTILLSAVAVALHAQVTSLMPPPVVQFFDDNGNPLAGGRICTYAAGTTTPLATYTDATGSTSNGTSVALGANGEAVNNIWLSPVAYKIVIRASGGDGTCGAGGGTIRKTVDNVYNWGQVLKSDLANTSDSAKGDALVGFKQPITGSTASTVHEKLSRYVDVKDFGAVGDGTTDSTTALNSAATYATANGKCLYLPAGTYLTSTGISVTTGICIKGEGKFIAGLKLAGGATRPSGLTGGVNVPGVLVVPASSGANVDLSDFFINGNNGGLLNVGLVHLQGASNFSVRDLWLYNGGIANECVSGSPSPTCGAYGQYSGVNGVSVGNATRDVSGTITGILAEVNTKAGINWSGLTKNGTISNNVCRNNTGNGYTPGIQVYADGVVNVVGNTAYSNQGDGFFTLAGPTTMAANVNISGNISHDNGVSGLGSGHGFSVINGAVSSVTPAYFSITGNVAYNNGNNVGQSDGFFVQNVYYGVISSNVSHDNNNNGFGVQNSLNGGVNYLTKWLNIVGNVAINNSKRTAGTWDGFSVYGGQNITLDGNMATDTQGVKTQNFGINVTSCTVDGVTCLETTKNVYLKSNTLTGNLAGPFFTSTLLTGSTNTGFDEYGVRFTSVGAGSLGDWRLWTEPSGGGLNGSWAIRDLINSRNVLRVESGSPTDSLLLQLSRMTLSNTVNIAGAASHLEAASNAIRGSISLVAATTGSATFSANFSSAPLCVLTPQFDVAAVRYWVTTSISQVTVNTNTNTTGTFSYHCVGNPN